MSRQRTFLWQFLAGCTVGVSLLYLHWRWTSSLNPDALVFSIVIASAETLFFFGTLLFFHDIWQESDTPQKPYPNTREDVVGDGCLGPILVDLFITTYDEDLSVVVPSVLAAKAMEIPPNTKLSIWILDDGNRPAFAKMAFRNQIGYLSRDENTGFKAGNLRNALKQTEGDFVIICDADTRIFPTFIVNVLGYFREPTVAWVQTPHWFYDLPSGQPWQNWVTKKIAPFFPQKFVPSLSKVIGSVFRSLSGQKNTGVDPFMSDPTLFFDVIQRRRNRNGASFCCGAGSIHRREALYQSALARIGSDIAKNSELLGHKTPIGSSTFQPFRFHVSEDIYTSIQLHSDQENRWISVYHPKVECRMLSPWTTDAWATQKLKYAGGTFDIMLHDNPVFQKGMPWKTKLHYGATFWSYLSLLWVPVMMLAPVFSLFTGWAPVRAYSVEFFAQILPVLILSELAMVTACKGYNISPGRIMAIGGLPINARAFLQVLRGQKPCFPATPKTPVFSNIQLKRMATNIGILALMSCAILFGIVGYALEFEGYGAPFLIVNIFWIIWNSISLLRVVSIVFWRPEITKTDIVAKHKGPLPDAIA